MRHETDTIAVAMTSRTGTGTLQLNVQQGLWWAGHKAGKNEKFSPISARTALRFARLAFVIGGLKTG
ncbi:hypothetical protein T281_11560 [Rhodomicrobium udaipurense JA643]|nr:hypothetical protein T281_11560 [Rhodomicrobium udaipurense JA643]